MSNEQALREALTELLHAAGLETGFAAAIRSVTGIPYPWPALDMAEQKARAALTLPASAHGAEPIDMVLHCPMCGLQHIDAPERNPNHQPDGGYPGCDVCTCAKGEGCAQNRALWGNPPHRSHLCHGCSHIWRPADVPTNGVPAVKTTGKADHPIPAQAAQAGAVPLWWHAECADPDYSGFFENESEAQCRCDEHGGGTVTPLYAAAPSQPAPAPTCSCPSGDGSLQWPCKVHPPAPAQPDAADAARYRWIQDCPDVPWHVFLPDYGRIGHNASVSECIDAALAAQAVAKGGD